MPAMDRADAPPETAPREKPDLSPSRMPYRLFILHRVAKTHHSEDVGHEDVDKRKRQPVFRARPLLVH
jgi:hypothetical protein